MTPLMVMAAAREAEDISLSKAMATVAVESRP